MLQFFQFNYLKKKQCKRLDIIYVDGIILKAVGVECVHGSLMGLNLPPGLGAVDTNSNSMNNKSRYLKYAKHQRFLILKYCEHDLIETVAVSIEFYKLLKFTL